MSEENIGGEEGIIEERRKKLQLLRDKNKAYVNDFFKEHYAKSLHEKNDFFSKEELEKKNITGISVAGRIILMRVMGNASFATIRDTSGDIQIYISKNTIDIDCNYCTIIITKYPISGGNQNVTIIENWRNTIQVHTINNCTLTYSPYVIHQKNNQIN